VSDARKRREKRSRRSVHAPRRVYPLKQEHLQLIAELDRLFPDRAPFVDFGAVPAGAESVEWVTRRLYIALQSSFEQPLFVAFCHVNAERMLDRIGFVLERGAYPLARDGVLADLYVRVYEHLRALQSGRRTSWRVPFRWREPDEQWSVFDMLSSAVEAIVVEQVDFLAVCELPLPGLKLPDLDPGDGVVDQAKSLFDGRGSRIEIGVARHWIAHALLRMPEAPRRVLFLREKRGLSYRQIADELGLSPLEAAVRVREATLQLQDRVLRTLLAFEGDAIPQDGSVADPSPRTPDNSRMGRVLKLRRQTDPSPPAGSDREHEHDGDH
jgi:hypothetical protein